MRLAEDRLGAQILPYANRAGSVAQSALHPIHQGIVRYQSLPARQQARIAMSAAAVVVLVGATGAKILTPGPTHIAPALAATAFRPASPVRTIDVEAPAREPRRKRPSVAAVTPPAPPAVREVVPEPAPAAATAAPRPMPRLTEGEALRLAWDEAKKACLERLQQSSEYRSAVVEADALEARVRQLRIQDPNRELAETSVRWMEAKSRLNRLRQQALTDDEQVNRLAERLRARGLLK